MKKIIILILVLLLTLTNISFIFAEPIVIIFDGEISHVLVDSNDIDILLIFQQEAKDKMNAAHRMAEAARALGYKEDHPVIVLAGKEWNAWHNDWVYYEEQIKSLKAVTKDYPVAAAVWVAFTENGYTEAATAGIIGNMMAECGHHSLNLDYRAYNSSGGYYGLCQWSKKYYPQVQNTSLEFQINFLLETIMPDFYSETSISNATIRFAKEYEKCSSSSYDKRIEYANIAYDYFTSMGY